MNEAETRAEYVDPMLKASVRARLRRDVKRILNLYFARLRRGFGGQAK